VVFLLIALSIETAVSVLAYRAAADHLRRNDPRQLQNRSEVSFYFAPVTLRAGAALRSGDLVDYLRLLGYQDRADGIPASFSITGRTIHLSPRSKSFPDLAISVERGGIVGLAANGHPVDEAQIEPLPMQEFIRYLKDDSLPEQRVRRIVIPAGSVPEIVADAVTSAEDYRFFDHHGVDVLGIFSRVLKGEGGGSSITQQLVKNTIFKGAKDEFWQRYLSFLPPTLQRKSADIFLALAAERMMTKNEILAAYLSVVPLGAVDGVELHGVAAAAQEYFGKNLSEMNLSDAACLAGMFNRPSDYVTRARQGDYTELMARRNSVLDLMRRNKPQAYSSDVIEKAKAEQLQFVFASRWSADRPAQAYSRQFVELAARNLPPELARLETIKGGLTVFTTLDFRLQKEATQITEMSARDLQGKIARICRTESTNVDCNALAPEVSLVAMDPQNGHVLAMAEGVGSSFNYATARRSPGSVIKPFFYLSAIDQGIYRGQPFTAATIIDPQSDELSGYRPDDNPGRRSTVRIGLAKSYNFHAVAAANSAGLKQAIEFVGRLTGSHPALTGMAAIGGTAGSETSLLDLVQAYSVFANNGRLAAASFQQSFAHNGIRKAVADAQPDQVVDAGAAFIVTQMLRSVISYQGTSPKFLIQAGFKADSSVAAKSGTGMVADVWFISITPHLVVGVWAGLPQNEFPLRLSDGFTGGNVAAPIVAKFMRSVRQLQPDLLSGEFRQPPNITRLPTDPYRGCVKAKSNAEEYFIVGREPLRCLAK